jgi:hypothetical protein
LQLTPELVAVDWADDETPEATPDATPDATQDSGVEGFVEDAEPDLADTPAEELPKAFRKKAEVKRRTREAITAGLVWGGTSASLALLLLAAVVFRVQVVRLWPRTAGAYAALRLPVNPLGVAPADIQIAPGLENGRDALIVTGAERNVDSRPRGPVPLRISLYDKAGARLLSRVVDLPAPALGGGESRPFRVSFLDPPLAAVQVGVDFAPLPAAPPATNRSPRLRGVLQQQPAQRLRGDPGSSPHLRGEIAPAGSVAGAFAPLPPAAARPISASSPYALPTAARTQTE